MIARQTIQVPLTMPVIGILSPLLSQAVP